MILHFSNLIDHYDAFLLDAYGVFWGSNQIGMLPGAKEAMEYLVSHEKKVGILSNSTQLASKEKEKLAKHGVLEGVHYHFLLTSGEVARGLLTAGKLPFSIPRKTYWLFGSDHPRFSSHSILFEDTGYQQTMDIEEADFIYIAIPHLDGIDQENPDVFVKRVKEAALQLIPVLCTNPDRFAHEGLPPRLVVRQGMIAQMFEAQGAAVYFIGKPFPAVYEQALDQFGSIQPRRILMIGDTPETDIRGAHQLGFATALVTKTGIMSERMKHKNASSMIHQLPETDRPDFAIGSFELHSS
ncbi:MAG: TIGR01459 family HAD-type hydrolase [Anaerolineae bacterium]